jgi:hypothetical protein
MLWIGSQKASQEPTKGKIDQQYPTVIGFSIGLEGKLYRNPPFFLRIIPWVSPMKHALHSGRRTWLEQFKEAVNATDTEGILGMWNMKILPNYICILCG